MKKLIIITICILTIGLLPMWIDFGKGWQYTDFISQMVPFFLETKRMFATGAPWWTWNTYMGDNFIGGYIYYTVTSPFVWVVCLFPAKMLLWGILLSLYLKVICTACLAYWYFRTMQFSERYAILGSLLYCFSSFYICNLFFFQFCEPIMMFPLLLVAIEKFISGKRRSWMWLPPVVFAVVFINFYFALASLLMGSLYFFIRAYSERKLTFGRTGQAIGLVMLGIAMASFVLLPAVFHNMGGARAMAKFQLFVNLGSMIVVTLNALRTLVIPTITGGDPIGFGLPYPFCSAEPYITLFGSFATVVYLLRHRNWLSLICVILLIAYLTPLGGIFNGFTNSLYSRWLYGLNIFMILTVLYVLRDKSINLRPFFKWYVVAALVIVGLNIGMVFIYSELNIRIWLEAGLFAVNIILLAIGIASRKSTKYYIGAVAVCGCLNLMLAIECYTDNMGERTKLQACLEQEVFNREFSAEPTVMNYRTHSESAFTNHAVLENTPGVKGFHSSMNKHVIPLRETVQDEYWLSFIIDRYKESILTLLSVKNVETTVTDTVAKTYEVIHCENPHYVPMGFTYDTYVPESELQSFASQDLDKPLQMLAHLVVDSVGEPALSQYLKKSSVDPALSPDSVVAARRLNTVKDFEGNSKGFTCRSDFATTEVVFFSVPADDGFKAYIDDSPTQIYRVNLGMMAIVVPPGQHQIVFQYFPPGLKLGLIISLCAVVVYLLFALIKSKEVL